MLYKLLQILQLLIGIKQLIDKKSDEEPQKHDVRLDSDVVLPEPRDSEDEF